MKYCLQHTTPMTPLILVYVEDESTLVYRPSLLFINEFIHMFTWKVFVKFPVHISKSPSVIISKHWINPSCLFPKDSFNINSTVDFLLVRKCVVITPSTLFWHSGYRLFRTGSTPWLSSDTPTSSLGPHLTPRFLFYSDFYFLLGRTRVETSGI